MKCGPFWPGQLVKDSCDWREGAGFARSLRGSYQKKWLREGGFPPYNLSNDTPN